MTDTFYLTTAIFYPSPGPALHSLFEAIGADALARYQRLTGKEVRFLTGMDEHSANLERLAHRARERSPRPGRRVGRQLAGRVRSVRYQLRPIHPDHRPRPRARPRSRWSAAPRPPATSTRAPTPAGTAPATTSSRPSQPDRGRPVPGPPHPGAPVAGGGELLLRAEQVPGRASRSCTGPTPRSASRSTSATKSSAGWPMASRTSLSADPAPGGGSRSPATRPTASMSGSTPSPTTSPAPAFPQTTRPSRSGGRPTST